MGNLSGEKSIIKQLRVGNKYEKIKQQLKI